MLTSFRNRIAVPAIVYLGCSFALLISLSYLPGPTHVQLSDDTQGYYNLEEADFSHTIYSTSPVWDSWPEALYSAEQLAQAENPQAHEEVDYTQTAYVTHRLLLSLEPGVTYGLSFYTSEYSMVLFMNGSEVVRAGSPGTTAETTQPLVHKTVYYFTPQDSDNELVVHAANFEHREGGRAPTLLIGTAENIAVNERNDDLRLGVVFGCLMTASLIFFSIFLMNRRQVPSLIFSVLCMLLALASGDFIVRLFPEYSWQLSLRLEYATYILAAGCLTVLVKVLFPTALQKVVFRGYLAICGVYLFMVLFFDTKVFTQFTFMYQGISIAMICYGVLRLSMTVRRNRPKNILALLGIALFTLFIVADISLRHNIDTFAFLEAQTFNSATGMVLFVFCYALVVSIEEAEIEVRFNETQATLHAVEEKWRLLREKSNKGVDPLMFFSSHGLTQREKEVGLLLIDGKSRSEICSLLHISMGTVNSHCTNIYRKTETSSVADLMNRIQSN